MRGVTFALAPPARAVTRITPISLRSTVQTYVRNAQQAVRNASNPAPPAFAVSVVIRTSTQRPTVQTASAVLPAVMVVS